MRRSLLLGLLAVAAMATCVPAAHAQSAFTPFAGTPTPAGGNGAVRADRDGDRVYESLEHKLSAGSRDARVRVIVMLDEPATAEKLRGIQRAVGGFALKARFRIIDGFAAIVSKGQVRALAARGDVIHVEDDALMYAQNAGAQSSFGVSAARDQVPGLDGNADGSASYSSGDLVAAVIDTGIDGGHVALDGGKVLAFKDFINNVTTPYDDNGHGSHVAGTIAGDGDGSAGAVDKGVAPGGALVGLKTLAANGSGPSSGTIQALDWIVANKTTYGIEVVNMSLGTNGCNNGTDASSTAVNNAHNAGLVMAVAAGNAGPGTCTVGSPGTAENALTVGNMGDSTEGGYFQNPSSSRGPTLDGRVKPDVSAPGTAIRSVATNTGDGYINLTGTSMATPFVAGVALLMLERNSALSPQQIKDAIMFTALDWGAPGKDNEYGYGRLDAYAAISSAGSTLSSPPSVASHHTRTGSLTAGASQDFLITTGNTSAYALALTNIETTAGVVFDVNVLYPDGAAIPGISAVNGGRQDTTTISGLASNANYIVRVRSSSGSGSFVLDISNAVVGIPDTTAPDTSISAGPSGTTSSSTASFSFTSPEAGASFECRIDSGAYSACTSPKLYSPLSHGSHTFDVRAKDRSGNADASPATRTWTVDLVPPEAPTITSGPDQGSVTSSTSASFAFSGSSDTASYECSLDGASYAVCTSPKGYTALGNGSHSFVVRAKDAVGNAGNPTYRSWSVDTTEPDSTIDAVTPAEIGYYSPPEPRTASRSASFSFSSSKQGSTFECRVDGATFASCVSPKSYASLGDGSHTFEVRAIDALGTTETTPSSRTWTVDGTPPDTTITSGPPATVTSGDISFTFTSTEPGGSFECKLDSDIWRGCLSPNNTIIGPGTHTWQVRAIDALGNVDPSPASRSWTFTQQDTSQPGTTTTTSTPPPTYFPPPPAGTVSSTAPSTGTTSAPAADTSAPTLTVGVSRQTLAGVTRKGLRLALACSEACVTRVKLKVGTRLVGRATVSFAAAGSRATRVKLTTGGKAALKRMRAPKLLVQAVVADASGNSRTVSRVVKLRR